MTHHLLDRCQPRRRVRRPVSTLGLSFAVGLALVVASLTLTSARGADIAASAFEPAGATLTLWHEVDGAADLPLTYVVECHHEGSLVWSSLASMSADGGSVVAGPMPTGSVCVVMPSASPAGWTVDWKPGDPTTALPWSTDPVGAILDASEDLTVRHTAPAPSPFGSLTVWHDIEGADAASVIYSVECQRDAAPSYSAASSVWQDGADLTFGSIPLGSTCDVVPSVVGADWEQQVHAGVPASAEPWMAGPALGRSVDGAVDLTFRHTLLVPDVAPTLLTVGVGDDGDAPPTTFAVHVQCDDGAAGQDLVVAGDSDVTIPVTSWVGCDIDLAPLGPDWSVVVVTAIGEGPWLVEPGNHAHGIPGPGENVVHFSPTWLGAPYLPPVEEPTTTTTAPPAPPATDPPPTPSPDADDPAPTSSSTSTTSSAAAPPTSSSATPAPDPSDRVEVLPAVEVTTVPAGSLPRTGAGASTTLVTAGLALVLVGGMAVVAARRAAHRS